MHKVTFPTEATLVDRSICIDDFVAGAEDDNGAISIYYELTAFMRKYSFPMGKCASNSEHLKNKWIVSGIEIKSVAQVLGVS